MRNNYDFGKVNNARVDLITRGLLKLLVEEEPRPELVLLALSFLLCHYPPECVEFVPDRYWSCSGTGVQDWSGLNSSMLLNSSRLLGPKSF